MPQGDLINKKMGRMTPREWRKPNGKTGEPRLEILKRIIKNNEPLITAQGKFIVLDTTSALNKIDEFKDKSIELKGKINDRVITISSSDILKSHEFGGGGGSGAGSDKTTLIESAQCYYCSAVVNNLNKEGSVSDFTPVVLKSSAKFVAATEKIENIINTLPEDYIMSSIYIANDLFKRGYIKRGMSFHRDSNLMVSIYKQAKIAMDNSSINIQKNKWNPGDIWAYDGRISDNIKLNTSSLETINEDIANLFRKKELVSLSLKKVISSKPPLKIFNLKTDRPTYYLIKYIPYKRKNLRESTRVLIEFNSGVLAGRAFQHLTNWSFEIQGMAAQGGKIGLNPIMNIFKLNNVQFPLKDSKQLVKIIKNPNDNDLKSLYIVYQRFENPLDLLTYEQFRDLFLYQDLSLMNWLYSKMTGLLIFDTLQKQSKSKQEKIVNDLILYSSSNLEISSAFIKIGK